MTAADVFQQRGSPAGLPIGPPEHGMCLCRHGYHRWPPQPESDWTSSHLTQCRSIRWLLEMRNSHPVTCESPLGSWTKWREGRTGVWLYGYKTSQSPSGKSERSNCESACRAGGDESLQSDGEKRRETCFREVGGLFRVWVTFTAFGAIPSEPGCTPEPVFLGPDIKSFFPVSVILRRNCN